MWCEFSYIPYHKLTVILTNDTEDVVRIPVIEYDYITSEGIQFPNEQGKTEGYHRFILPKASIQQEILFNQLNVPTLKANDKIMYRYKLESEQGLQYPPVLMNVHILEKNLTELNISARKEHLRQLSMLLCNNEKDVIMLENMLEHVKKNIKIIQ